MLKSRTRFHVSALRLRLALAGVVILGAGVVAGQKAAGATHAGTRALQGAEASPVMLPVLNFQGDNDVCRTWLAVQNVGAESSKYTLVVWDTAPATGCNGPLKAECSGIVAPGSSWQFLGPQVPSGSNSGAIYSFSVRPLSEFGVAEGVDLVGEWLCERVFFGTVGNCVEFAAFHAAYVSGGLFEGVSMAAARGAPASVTVLRHCPAAVIPGAEASGSYSGLNLGPEVAAPDAPGMYRAVAYPVKAAQAPRPGHTGEHLAVQNAGAEAALLAVKVRPLGSSDDADCGFLNLQPGEAGWVPLGACADPGEAFVAIVESDQPVAALLDTTEGEVMTSVLAEYARLPSDPRGEGSGGRGSELYGVVASAAGGLYVFQHGSTDADVTVTWRAKDGTIVGEETTSICGQCLGEFAQPEPWSEASLPGSVIVSGSDGAQLGGVFAGPDAGHEGAGQASRHGLVPASLVRANGQWAAAVPMLVDNLRGTGVTTDLVVANFGTGDATARVAAYDDNHLVGLQCFTVPAGETALISPPSLPFEDGFLGAGIISAVPAGGAAGDLMLAAVIVTRTGSREEVPGDELALELAPRLLGEPVFELPDCDAGELPPWQPDPTVPIDRQGASRARVHLPILSHLAQDPSCTPTVLVTNLGDSPGKVIMIYHGEPGFCHPQCAGPLAVHCSGLIGPGEVWAFTQGTDLPFGAMTAVAYSVNDQTMGDLGIDPGSSELAADALCAALFLDIQGDCDHARRFQLAFALGAEWNDFPLSGVVGAPISAEVTRQCPDTAQDSVTNTSTYIGIQSDRFDPWVQGLDGYVQAVTPAYGSYGGLDTIVYVHNGGATCATVSIEYRAAGQWGAAGFAKAAGPSGQAQAAQTQSRCSIFALAAGETFPVRTNDCIGPNFQGSMVIYSTGPVAIVADVVGPGRQSTFLGRATENPFDLNEDGKVDAGDLAVIDTAMGSVPGDAIWNPAADLDADLAISASDRQLLLAEITGQAPPTQTSTPPTGTSTPSTSTPTATATTTTATPTPTGERLFRVYLPLASTDRR